MPLKQYGVCIRHTQIAAACLALQLALLAACGGGGGSGTPAPTPTPTPAPPPNPVQPDGGYHDPVVYSTAPTGSLVSAVEGAAVVPGSIALAGKTLAYTATTGHLTAIDAKTGAPAASFFYVAYTAGTQEASKRPVTFFYNGGPGSASMWLHLGSFGPKRIVTNVPSTVMPAATQIVDNQETVLDHSDLVFVDAIGTGYSQAIAPKANVNFWGIDSDAAAFRDFVQRYVVKNNRQASPKYLFGESYGGPRTGVMANLLEVAGVKLAGVVLQSAIMNYNSNCGVLNPGAISCEGYVPSYAATAAYYKLSNPAPTDFSSYLAQARTFSATQYRPAMTAFLSNGTVPPDAVLAQLSAYSGLPALTWRQDFDMGPNAFRQRLVSGTMIGRYDARVSAPLGSALTVDNDPSLTVVNATFVNAIRNYIETDLRYKAGSNYASFNSVINGWDFSHDGKPLPDTIPDLAAAIALNPALKVVAMSGYHDMATPFYQTELDLARLGNNPNIIIKNYDSGHMSYLDNVARKAQRLDLINLYNSESVAK